MQSSISLHLPETYNGAILRKAVLTPRPPGSPLAHYTEPNLTRWGSEQRESERTPLVGSVAVVPELTAACRSKTANARSERRQLADVQMKQTMPAAGQSDKHHRRAAGEYC